MLRFIEWFPSLSRNEKTFMTEHYSLLPQTSEAFEHVPWVQIERWYRELEATTLSPKALEPWLRQWSRLSTLIDETQIWLEIATTRNTADEALSQRRQRFLDEILTPVQNCEQQMKQQLLESGLEPEGFAIPLRKLQVDTKLFHNDYGPPASDPWRCFPALGL